MNNNTANTKPENTLHLPTPFCPARRAFVTRRDGDDYLGIEVPVLIRLTSAEADFLPESDVTGWLVKRLPRLTDDLRTLTDLKRVSAHLAGGTVITGWNDPNTLTSYALTMKDNALTAAAGRLGNAVLKPMSAVIRTLSDVDAPDGVHFRSNLDRVFALASDRVTTDMTSLYWEPGCDESFGTLRVFPSNAETADCLLHPEQYVLVRVTVLTLAMSSREKAMFTAIFGNGNENEDKEEEAKDETNEETDHDEET